MIKTAIFSSFLSLWEKTANVYLRLDPESFSALSALDSKVIQIHLKGIEVTFFMRFVDSHGITLQSHCEDAADMALSASPLALPRLALNQVQGSSHENFRVDIELTGDIALAQRVQNLMASMDVDWEEILAKLVGDLAAHKIGYAAQQGKRFLGESKALLDETVREYLTEESDTLVTAYEIEHHIRAVDDIRDDVERLASRIALLK